MTQFHWDEHNSNFDWYAVSLDQYPQVAEDGSRNIADVTDSLAVAAMTINGSPITDPPWARCDLGGCS